MSQASSIPSFSLEASLARTSARPSEVLARFASQSRVDVTGAPPGLAAYLLSKHILATERVIVLTSDTESARRVEQDIAFHLGDSRGVLVYPASDVSPYLEVAADRRAAMDRLATLFHLSHGLPWRALIVPVAAAMRRAVPAAAIRSRSAVVKAEEELDREAFLNLLVEGGYLRTPVAEDPGTFSVRGNLIDVFTPHADYPARIELDDWLVLSIKRFDPDNQRTIDRVREVYIHPARDTLLGESEVELARTKVRSLCDAVDYPTSKTRALIEDLESGRAFYGLEGFLPAFFSRLDTVFDYVDQPAAVAVLDPTSVIKACSEETGRAASDHAAAQEEGRPLFPLSEHYLDDRELASRLQARRLLAFHRIVVGGQPDDEESDLSYLECADIEDVHRLGGEDQRSLTEELKAKRAARTDDTLETLAQRTREWADAGLRIVFAARTMSQAERLQKLLRRDNVPVESKPSAYDPNDLDQQAAGTVHVAVGSLQSGFLLASDGVCFVTEEEIFGNRGRRRSKKAAKSRNNTQPFVEDLRELKVGDYVVHIDHGIGRYLGLERKALGQSQLDRLHGREAREVEVLLVEYSAGDRLYLPVTRLNQIQKLSGKEGHQPKLDKLGGQTFAKTKSKVRKKVQQLAEELLKLYAERAAAQRDALPPAEREYEAFEATFPFEETPDQARAIGDVLDDLEEGRPMDRVVCGDVGFGKTEVAIRAAFRAAMAGRQVAMLCPTTVLAQQHFQTFRDRLEGYPIEVAVLSRFVDKAHQTETVTALKEGKVDVVVGTHRLLSKDVHFKQLGLLIVDEEQRFGVAHKERIKKLRKEVDVLTLSATPIPRTLQMAIGGLRDLSLITTPPTDRRAVRTFATRWDDHILTEAIRRELRRGGQVFFVFNRIDGLYERGNRIQELVPEAKVAVAHGQMTPSSLERLMTDFVEGRFDVLCSTAIIESGLDIPRANTMIIDRADLFGLAQLYQLRGRVGRSKERAYCYLLTPPPSRMTDDARYRIEALERFTELGSGFHVASLDMEQRGAGDILGVEQSGAVAQVGFDLFVHMLEDAVAQLKGETVSQDVDPEVTLDLEWYLPDDYVEDVGLRLSFYKRFAEAEDEQSVADLGAELEDRFGTPPRAAQDFIRAMSLRPQLRTLCVLGAEGTPNRVTLHLRADTPLDPAKVMPLVTQRRDLWKLTQDMRLTRRFEAEEGKSKDAIERIETLLSELAPLTSS